MHKKNFKYQKRNKIFVKSALDLTLAYECVMPEHIDFVIMTSIISLS